MYPAVVLALDVLQFIAPRAIVSEGWTAVPAEAMRSIVAGVGSGVGLAKSLLYDVLEHFHSRFPATIADTWVDDLGVTRGGTVRMLKLHFPPAVAGLCADLNERGLEQRAKTRCWLPPLTLHRT